jgi:LmbE family N-acetylglucosaminyl deacetylase
MASPLTLMAVHAHPDDESSSTGGILARYSAEGIRTVVVTCTNGEYGDAPGGIKPGADGHDPDDVARIRRDELERACATLGVTHLEMLGYSDSGMSDWEYKDHAHVFCNVPIEESTERLSKLYELYRPDVVVTYDEQGGYNHPDHVQASRIAFAALEATGIPRKAYLIARRRRDWAGLRELLEAQGVELPPLPEPTPERLRMMEEAEARITTDVDVSGFVEQKRDALVTHASQIAESWFGKLPAEAYRTIFGTETFIRAHDTTGVAVPEDDLFAGLRS